MNSSKVKSEISLRDQLIERSNDLLDGNNSEVLSIVLRRLFCDVKFVFVINWIPDQVEDIYWVLVGPLDIAQIEIMRGDGGCQSTLKMIDLATYRRRQHSKETRERLSIALDIVKSIE